LDPDEVESSPADENITAGTYICRRCGEAVQTNNTNNLREHLRQCGVRNWRNYTAVMILRIFNRADTTPAVVHAHVSCRGCHQEIDYFDTQGAIRYTALRHHLSMHHHLDADSFTEQVVLNQFTAVPLRPRATVLLRPQTTGEALTQYQCRRCGIVFSPAILNPLIAMRAHLQERHNITTTGEGTAAYVRDQFMEHQPAPAINQPDPLETLTPIDDSAYYGMYDRDPNRIQGHTNDFIPADRRISLETLYDKPEPTGINEEPDARLKAFLKHLQVKEGK
jgi:DNA-directed RNA polymerase subunit RPC12/RpoP